MKRILITGADGFTGRYLAGEFSRAGYEVHGLVRFAIAERLPGVSALHVADLADEGSLLAAVREVQPNMVAHLAAIAFVPHGDVQAIYQTNLIGTRNLLNALVQTKASLEAVLLASSANVYGNGPGGVLDESTFYGPVNDYAVSKVAMELMAKLFTDRLPIVMVRPFNYTGIGQSDSFLLPKIVSHVRRRDTVIELGNLDSARDFSDVRTVVQYYKRLLECPAATSQTFNVCSGRAYSLKEVLEIIGSLSGHKLEIRVNPAFVRANEVKFLWGSRDKLLNMVGVVPDIPLRDTLRWMLEGEPGASAMLK